MCPLVCLKSLVWVRGIMMQNKNILVLPLTALFCVSMITACGGDKRKGPAESSFVVGTEIDAGAFETTQECPLDFICNGQGRCVPANQDRDGDGFTAEVDCDDNDPQVYPGAAEVCNGKDNNCNGVIDEGVTNACGSCGPAPTEICNLQDDDCDGVIDNACVAGTVEETEPNNGSSQCQQIALPPNNGDVQILTGKIDPVGDI